MNPMTNGDNDSNIKKPCLTSSLKSFFLFLQNLLSFLYRIFKFSITGYLKVLDKLFTLFSRLYPSEYTATVYKLYTHFMCRRYSKHRSRTVAVLRDLCRCCQPTETDALSAERHKHTGLWDSGCGRIIPPRSQLQLRNPIRTRAGTDARSKEEAWRTDTGIIESYTTEHGGRVCLYRMQSR